MKNILKLSVPAIAALALIVAGCGKYEEGPGMSLRTKKGRMVNQWKLEETVDSAGYVNTYSGTYTMELSKDGAVAYNGGTSPNTTWDFSSNKEQLVITFVTIVGNVVFSYDILKLKNKELWLKDPTDGTQEHYVTNE